jgi:hypothetical protein
MKRQIFRTLQKYLFNPPIKLALGMGVPIPARQDHGEWVLPRHRTHDSCITEAHRFCIHDIAELKSKTPSGGEPHY